MEESGTTRVSLKEENGFALELERSKEVHVQPYVEAHPKHPPMPVQQTQPKGALKEKKEAPSTEESGESITSPMVGTFYASASPDEPSFVKVGDSVKEDTVVCIIEAMKVMNEVKAGKSGKITKVFADNAQPVEFGTQLFQIEG